MLKKIDKILILLIAVGVVLRLYGIFHGFPFILHPDEPTVVRSALALRFNLNPGHFDWPHLYIYVNYLLYIVVAKARSIFELFQLRSALESIFPIIWDDTLFFYIVSRFLTVFVASLTAIPIYLSSKLFFSRLTALATSAMFIVLPFHVWQSHYVLIDVPMTFWVAWSTYFALRILKFNRRVDYIVSGLFIGFAASTKYNGGLICVSVFLASLMYSKISLQSIKSNFSNLVHSGLASILGFLIGTPYALFDYETFLRNDSPKGALWQFSNVGSVSFSEQMYNMYRTFTATFMHDLGVVVPILWMAALVIFIYWLTKRISIPEPKVILFLLTMSLFLVYYISGFEKNRSHYYMVSYPFVVLTAGYALEYIFSRIRKDTFRIILSVFLLSIPLAMSVRQSYIFARTDTRVQLYQWLQTNTTTQDSIVFGSRNLEQIFVKLRYRENVARKNLLNDSISKYRYVVVTYSSAQDEAGYKTNSSQYLKKVSFDNYLRKGPNISVYEYIPSKP